MLTARTPGSDDSASQGAMSLLYILPLALLRRRPDMLLEPLVDWDVASSPPFGLTATVQPGFCVRSHTARRAAGLTRGFPALSASSREPRVTASDFRRRRYLLRFGGQEVY